MHPSFPIIPGFQIQSRLGWGGMGVVYEAVEQGLGRRIALKVIPACGRWSHFRREMEALARLTSPGVVTLYAHGQTPDHYFYSMELVEGESLSAFLARKKGGGDLPSPEDVRRHVLLVREVARTLAYAHSLGVFHRDLSPSNILIPPGSVPKLIDFGLAEVTGLSTITVSGSVFGTPSYLGPEVLLGAGARDDALQDLYALGIVLYEGLTLSHPYPHETVEQLFLRLGSADPVPPRKVHRGIPRPLESVVLKAIAKDPRERYLSVEEFGLDLDSFLAGRPVTARGRTSGTRVLGAVRRGRSIFLCLGFAAVFSGLLAGGYHLYRYRERSAKIKTCLDGARSALERRDLRTVETLVAMASDLGAVREVEGMALATAALRAVETYEALYLQATRVAEEKGTTAAASALAEAVAARDEALRSLKRLEAPLPESTR